VKTRVVARRYAEAFFQVIRESTLEEAYADFSGFMEAMRQSDEMRAVLKHPAVKVERKTELLKSLLSSSTQPVVNEFLCLLLRRHRFVFIDLIAQEVRDLYRREKRIVRVLVRTAVPLLEPERQDLIERLKKQVQGTIELKEQVEPQLKGGMILCFSEKVLDTSVKTRLKLLRERLAHLKSELLSSVQGVPALVASPGSAPTPSSPSH